MLIKLPIPKGEPFFELKVKEEFQDDEEVQKWLTAVTALIQEGLPDFIEVEIG